MTSLAKRDLSTSVAESQVTGALQPESGRILKGAMAEVPTGSVSSERQLEDQ